MWVVLFNKKGSIEHTVEVIIYYQRHRGRIEIDVILGILWLVYHNSKID